MLALLKGFLWEEATILSVVFLALLPFREAFPRAARLTRMEVTPGWMVSAIPSAAMVGEAAIVGAGPRSRSRNVDYGGKTFLGCLSSCPDADAARALRCSASPRPSLLLAIQGCGAWSRPPPRRGSAATDDPDFHKVRAILAPPPRTPRSPRLEPGAAGRLALPVPPESGGSCS